MKKEFKAPIVEIKELSALNDIMVSFASGEANDSKLATYTDSEVSDNYKIWKGLN